MYTVRLVTTATASNKLPHFCRAHCMLYQPRLGLGDLATAQIVSSFFEGYPFAFEDCQDRKLEKKTKRSHPFQTNSHWSKEPQLATHIAAHVMPVPL